VVNHEHKILRADKGWQAASLALRGLTLALALLLGACGNTDADIDRSPASAIAKKLERPDRLLIGLGTTDIRDIKAQKLSLDILDQYLVGVGKSSWPYWNSPRGDYVRIFTERSDSIGAVPMFTLYQMASNGDGNLSGLSDRSFMKEYWDNVTLLFIKLGQYGKPVIVNLEPDFWGYAQKESPNGDPTALAAWVSINPECENLPDNVTGIAACQLRSARKYAPRALLGFPVSDWGGRTPEDVTKFMKRLGADQADLIVFPSLDRDAGCFEQVPQPEGCERAGTGWYWDESSVTSPNFRDYLGVVQSYHEAMNGLPVLWWQTPLGVPSDIPGGQPGQYRDNRVRYFLTHPEELVAAGGVGVVFSAGRTGQTDITTDGGQFRILSLQYLASPATLR